MEQQRLSPSALFSRVLKAWAWEKSLLKLSPLAIPHGLAT